MYNVALFNHDEECEYFDDRFISINLLIGL
jgi:hypothetical protein